MMNMTCPEDFQLTLNNQTALHNIQALQAGNFLLQSYNGSSPYPGQLLLQGYPGSSHISQLLNTNSLAAVSTQSQLSQLSYPTPAVVDKAAAAAAAAAAAQTKKFRPPLKSGSKTNKYIPKPIPQELGNLKTYSNPDILICGNCRELFSDLVDMLEHKKNYCKMRFTCKCELGSQNSAEQHNHSSISNNSGCEDGNVKGKKCT
ncbi:uncharacterized protein LOC111699963 isoform X2 [Eurytemora carolleeae]|uniref:uncharacterized protein LOC111699963 isoform X2 n=1 Tax=Eurytemora carolleeae TaxID=1294199 RepID=UPI000C7575F1|nr:uncharacterized protein LOC111699963 isoform X2 [Eurytemora carolleeae]|eukprot:XP_023326534.1 uncharacterized protein LOC111699963 isoform X2 [Eurytemora affinis]